MSSFRLRKILTAPLKALSFYPRRADLTMIDTPVQIFPCPDWLDFIVFLISFGMLQRPELFLWADIKSLTAPLIQNSTECSKPHGFFFFKSLIAPLMWALNRYQLSPVWDVSVENISHVFVAWCPGVLEAPSYGWFDNYLTLDGPSDLFTRCENDHC